MGRNGLDRLFGLVIIAAAGWPSLAVAAEKPVITWVLTAPPPIHFDPATGLKGVKDEVLDWFDAHLPQYTIETSDAGVLRSLDYLKQQDGFCFPGLARTAERESYIAYSKPALWALPDRITVSAENAARVEKLVGADGSVTIKDMLVRSSLEGNREAGRGYPEAIAADFDRYGTAGNLLPIPNDADRFGMLVSGRFTWTMIDPATAHWIFGSQFPDFRYRTFAIAGYHEPVPVAFACSKKPLGLQIIRDLDALIEAHGKEGIWQAAYDRWLDPQALDALHRFEAAHPGR